MLTSIIIVLLVGVAGRTTVHAYTTGAPASACVSMMPNHYAIPQTVHCPYLLSTVSDGSTFNVTLAKESPSTKPFMGFLLQARFNGTTQIVGSFSNLPDGTRYQDCGAPDNSVTHTTKGNKDSVTFSWTTSGDLTGIQFVATVVQSFGIIWTNQVYDILL
jgi:hypothetical protein